MLEDSIFDNYIFKSKEEKLEILTKCYHEAKDERHKIFFEGRLVELTIDMDEHPEWMQDVPCYCATCCSY